MGRWGQGFFEDDLAFDIKGYFDDAVAGGRDPAEVGAGLLETELAQEILDEFAEDERDEMFWEESSALFYAVALLQLGHDVVQDDVRRLTLEAIEHELPLLDREAEAERVEALRELESRLKQVDALWEVWRLDDNDNEFMMKRFDSEEAATAYCKEFEARGHRQTYWVKRAR